MPKNLNKKIIENIYTNIVKTSRNKKFFLELEVDDTVEGRFDVIILHSFIIFHYFIAIGEKNSKISQDIFDYMFLDFDSNLREMGFGDIAVNKRMKQFIKAFYGRISNYDRSVEAVEKLNDHNLLRQTIQKNIYKDDYTKAGYISLWEKYIIANIGKFKKENLKENISNYFDFNPI